MIPDREAVATEIQARDRGNAPHSPRDVRPGHGRHPGAERRGELNVNDKCE